jgi:hypothetical protein
MRTVLDYNAAARVLELPLLPLGVPEWRDQQARTRRLVDVERAARALQRIVEDMACDEADMACDEAEKACDEAEKACDEAEKACDEAEKAESA